MTVIALNRNDCLAVTLTSLGVMPASIKGDPNTVLIAQSLRRAIVFLAPCQRSTLDSAVTQVISPLLSDPKEAIRAQVTAMLDALIASGDILEIWDEPGAGEPRDLHVWAAPASFVTCPNGKMLLLGSNGDALTYVPEEMKDSVIYQDCDRILPVGDQSDLEDHLSEFGLFKISERDWLKRPASRSPTEALKPYFQRLERAHNSGKVEGLTILAEPGQYYRSRWREPLDTDNGIFIARRSQRFGAELWSLVNLQSGQATRLIDLRAEDQFQRPYDLAWYLQYALSADQASPERYLVSEAGAVATIAIYFPLPRWAERHLLLSSERERRQGALFTYEMPLASLAAEEDFLKSDLWMCREVA